jgi:hypothetical protein
MQPKTFEPYFLIYLMPFVKYFSANLNFGLHQIKTAEHSLLTPKLQLSILAFLGERRDSKTLTPRRKHLGIFIIY